MEVLTAVDLWQQSDFETLELEPTVVKRQVNDNIESVEMFFTGGLLDVQKIRIYARVTRRLQDDNPPVVMLCDDIGVSIADRDITHYLELGYAVVQYDYLGKRDDSPKATIYPQSIDYCNHYAYPDNIYIPTDSPTDFCWYYYSIVTFRTIKLIQSLTELDSNRIVLIGIGAGGTNAIKTAVISQGIVGLLVRFDADIPIRAKDNSSIINMAALGSGSYTPFLEVPTLIELASNEADGSFDDMAELFGNIGKDNQLARLSISESKNHSLDTLQQQNETIWLSNILHTEAWDSLPKQAKISKSIADNHLYISVNVFDDSNVDKVYVYISEDNERGLLAPAYRYWQKLVVENIGDGEYLAKIKADSVQNYSVFANIKYDSGLCLSTELLKITTGALKGGLLDIDSNRLVYDSEMGIDNWTIMSREAQSKGEVEFVTGPYDIDGVTSEGCELVLFKIGDRRFRGGEDSTLQLTIYSSVAQRLSFATVSSCGYIEYVCHKEITPVKNWSKITLLATDFKGAYRFKWADALMLKINSESPIILSSVLWL